MAKIIVSDRMWIPASIAPMGKIDSMFLVESYDDASCRTCDQLQDRPTETCLECPSFREPLQVWTEKKINGENHIGVPAPDYRKILKKLRIKESKHKIVVKRAAPEMDNRIRFKGKLFTGKEKFHGHPTADQETLVRDWLKYVHRGGGLIVSPPRSGKTVIGTAVTCKVGMKTIIMASQRDWLIEFAKTFAKMTKGTRIALATRGTDPAPFKGTNVDLVKWEDLLDCEYAPDVLLTTYQSLFNKKRLRWARSKFGLLVVDETHQAPSRAFGQVISAMNVYARCGLTATVERMDELSRFVPLIMGPIRSHSTAEAILPTVELWETGIKFPQYKQWAGFENAVSKKDIRNKMLVDRVFDDLAKHPNHCVLVPVRRVAHVLELVRAINDRAVNEGGFDLPLALAFTGGTPRDSLLEKVRSRQVRVVVATERLVKLGINVPAWSVVYINAGSATSNGPGVYQLARRVSTPDSEKPPPIVRILIDNCQVSVLCFRKLWCGVDTPDRLRDGVTGDGVARYRMSDKTFKRIEEITAYPKAYVPQSDTVFGGNRRKRKQDGPIKFW